MQLRMSGLACSRAARIISRVGSPGVSPRRSRMSESTCAIVSADSTKPELSPAPHRARLMISCSASPLSPEMMAGMSSMNRRKLSDSCRGATETRGLTLIGVSRIPSISTSPGVVRLIR
jgi:hypothetical protein